MKKCISVVSFLLITLLFLNIFSIDTSFSAPADSSYQDGYSEGLFDGAEEAEIDMEEGNRKNYIRAIPSENEIVRIYGIKNESKSYISSFIDGYENGFKYGYEKTYRYIDDDKDQDKVVTAEYGSVFGKLMGEVYGYRDYYEGKSNRWRDAIPSNTIITSMFNLRKETIEYRTSFNKLFREQFEIGYEEGHRRANFEPIRISFEQGIQDGQYFGGIMGSTFGKKDFYDGKVSNWEANLPSDNIIVMDYSLKNDSEEYLKGFLTEFKRSFEENYNETYRKSNVELFTLTFETGYLHGMEIGNSRGTYLAQIDLILGQKNNSLRHKSSNYEITYEYKLYLENEKYREGFISGYNEGFLKSYLSTYQEENASKSYEKIVTDQIPISGGNVSSLDSRISLKVEKGTYYNDIIVSLEKLNDIHGNYLNDSNLTKASDIYTIIVYNPTYQLDKTKEIELSFEYYGPKNGGIYEYTNNSWVYLPSKLEENRIVSYISPGLLNTSSGTYAVFLDKNFKNINDIRGHWAKDEINTFLRRGITELFYDNTFRPNVPITRGQLLGLLNRTYKWNLNGLDENIKALERLSDYDKIGSYKTLTAYSIKQGYIVPYPDNLFRIDSQVTYNQVNNIMKKITGNSDFSWENVANSMMYNKDTRSKSYSSMDNAITRAEALYMLYLLNK
ncbi:MAG: S-layer homology domain-containing protein [Tissierellales bacterium]